MLQEGVQLNDMKGIVRSPLEPLLHAMEDFYTNEDLSARIQNIFNVGGPAERSGVPVHC